MFDFDSLHSILLNFQFVEYLSRALFPLHSHLRPVGFDLSGQLVLVLGNLLQFLVVADHPFVYIILVSLDKFSDFESMLVELLAQVHVVFISLEAYVEELLLFRRLDVLLLGNFLKSLVD